MNRDTTKIAEEVLEEKGSYLYCVSPDTTIFDALTVMNEKKIGAILIQDGESIVGIWTERDLMQDAILPDFNIKEAKVGDYMSTNLIADSYDSRIMNLADKILGLRVRHILIERDGNYIGLLSAGDVIRAGLQLRTEELEELDRIVHLKYYDEWKWTKKK